MPLSVLITLRFDFVINSQINSMTYCWCAIGTCILSILMSNRTITEIYISNEESFIEYYAIIVSVGA